MLNTNTWGTGDTKKKLAVVAGGSLGDRRNEETYSKYAAGARIKQHPSRRQQQRGLRADGNDYILWRKINLKLFDLVLFLGIIDLTTLRKLRRVFLVS